jgi:AcrR family transcriptional regulator
VPRRPKTAPRRPPRQKRSEETVAVLLEATEKVLARDGFAAATTNHIAHAAGVSIGTLYHYFPTKEALVQAVVHRMWADELALLDTGGAILLEAPLEVAVRTLVSGITQAIRRRQELVKRWYAEASHLGQLDVGLGMTDRASQLVQAALERHRERIRPTNLPFTADFLVKIVLAAVRTAARDYPAELASGEVENAVSDMVLRYLLRTPPA